MAAGLAMSASMTSQASLVINDLSITATNVSFHLTGTVDIVGGFDLDSLFFGFVGSTSWVTSTPVFAGGFSKNSGTYDFNAVGGADSNTWGDYLFTNGPDTLVVGDVIDLNYSIQGTFDLTGLNIMDFKVQAGYDGTSNDFIQSALIAGGVGSLANTVPEPASFGLAGLALAGLLVTRRKK